MLFYETEWVVKEITDEINKEIQVEFPMKIQYKEDMTSIYALKENQPDLSWVFKRFLDKDDEVLYFVSGEKLSAVVSIGDLFRCLEGGKQDILNTDFMCVREKEDEKALAFFAAHPTVHELPVIDNVGRFIGVMKSGERNSDKTQNSFRIYAKRLYYGEEAFYLKTAKKFMEHFKGIVFLADLPNDDVAVNRLKTDKEKEEYAEKTE